MAASTPRSPWSTREVLPLSPPACRAGALLLSYEWMSGRAARGLRDRSVPNRVPGPPRRADCGPRTRCLPLTKRVRCQVRLVGVILHQWSRRESNPRPLRFHLLVYRHSHLRSSPVARFRVDGPGRPPCSGWVPSNPLLVFPSRQWPVREHRNCVPVSVRGMGFPRCLVV